MSEKEIQKLRQKILRGVTASLKNMLQTKVKNNGSVAIMDGNRVTVVNAKDIKQ